MKFEWELCFKAEHYKHDMLTYRAKVHGGWLVLNRSLYISEFCESMIFIPDRFHEWTLDEEAKTP